jgi:hypothetical protein
LFINNREVGIEEPPKRETKNPSELHGRALRRAFTESFKLVIARATGHEVVGSKYE